MNSDRQLVDSHCHLHFPEFSDDLDAVLARATDNGVGYFLCVSVSVVKFAQIVRGLSKFLYNFVF